MDYLHIHKEAQDRVRNYQVAVSKFIETLERVQDEKV